MLQVREAGRRRRRRGARPGRAARAADGRRRATSAARGRAGTAAGRWRPGRCGCGRRAACRRAAPSRSIRPRSSAVCTSSSSASARSDPAATSAVELVERRRASRPSSSSVEQAGPVQHPGVGPGCRPGRRAPAASRSGPRPTAPPAPSDGPAGEPAAPQPRVGARVRRSARRASAAGRACAAILLGRPHSSTKPLARRLVEGVARVVGRQVEVVQRRLAAPAGHHGPAAVQRHPDVAGHVLVGVVDEAVQRPLERARTTGRRRPARPSAARRCA